MSVPGAVSDPPLSLQVRVVRSVDHADLGRSAQRYLAACSDEQLPAQAVPVKSSQWWRPPAGWPVAAPSSPGQDSSVDRPETRYAKTGNRPLHRTPGVRYRGEILFVPGYFFEPRAQLGPSCVRGPFSAASGCDLPASSPLIVAGTGRPDRLSPGDQPPLEILRMEDLGRVLDEVGSQSEPPSSVWGRGLPGSDFAATHPERTRALVLYSTSASGKWSPTTPGSGTQPLGESYFDEMASGWGKQQFAHDGLGGRQARGGGGPRAMVGALPASCGECQALRGGGGGGGPDRRATHP